MNAKVATGRGEGGGHPSKPAPRISIENVTGGYREAEFWWLTILHQRNATKRVKLHLRNKNSGTTY